jgi:hypothetical protein
LTRGLPKTSVAQQKEVDEERETLHNLTSLLLTNKTIRKAQQSKQYRIPLFKN